MEGACIRERLVLGKDLTLVICTRNDLTAASRNIVPATVTLVLGKDLMIVTCTRNDLTAASRNWNTVPKPGFQKKNHTKTPMCSNAQRFLEESMQQDTTAPCGAAASRHSLKDLKKKKKKKECPAGYETKFRPAKPPAPKEGPVKTLQCKCHRWSHPAPSSSHRGDRPRRFEFRLVKQRSLRKSQVNLGDREDRGRSSERRGRLRKSIHV
jgi:hypothetical protein